MSKEDSHRAGNVAQLMLSYHTQSPGFYPQNHINWVWWCTPAIPVLGRYMQEDHKFEIIIYYS